MNVYTYLPGNWIGSTLELTESISASSVYVRFENICFGLFPGSSILSYKLGGEMKFFPSFFFNLLCVVFSFSSPNSAICYFVLLLYFSYLYMYMYKSAILKIFHSFLTSLTSVWCELYLAAPKMVKTNLILCKNVKVVLFFSLLMRHPNGKG